MKIESLDEFRRQIENSMISYHKYLLEDKEECLEEGLEDYADQRSRQIDGLVQFMSTVNQHLWKLRDFIE